MVAKQQTAERAKEKGRSKYNKQQTTTSTTPTPTPKKRNDKDKETHTFENIFILCFKGLNRNGDTTAHTTHHTLPLPLLLLLQFSFSVCYRISVFGGYFIILHFGSFGSCFVHVLHKLKN